MSLATLPHLTRVPVSSSTSLRSTSLVSGAGSATTRARTYGYARSITRKSASTPDATPSSAANARMIFTKYGGRRNACADRAVES